jgi:hypothetical protein
MRLAALFLVVAVCGTSIAAPAPFLESSVPEAVLETGSKERTEALLRWLKAADLAQALLPGQSALPASFASKLKAIPKDGSRVILRFQGSARPVERALFEKLVGKVSTTTPRPALADTRTAEARVKMRAVIWRGGALRAGRGGVVLGDGVEWQQALQQMQDQDIRSNPPRLVSGPARR